jgi:hypothetical protein
VLLKPKMASCPANISIIKIKKLKIKKIKKKKIRRNGSQHLL